MKKPRKRAQKRYDYLECSRYLEQKYGYLERDYARQGEFFQRCVRATNKKFSKNGWFETPPVDASPEQLEAIAYFDELMKAEPPYQDFWHFLLKHCAINGNGCDFTMSIELMEVAEPWQQEILRHYFDEFDPKGSREIQFHVWW